jgi:5-methylcytosine-specific restriction enzyme subunit McrC
MMQPLTLTEHQPSAPVALTDAAIGQLHRRELSIEVRPFPGEGYVLTPGPKVGAIIIEDLALSIQPKFSITNLLFLLSFALNPRDWKDVGFDLREEDSIVEAIIPGFVYQVRHALAGGVLQGYVTKDEPLTTLRGRIRIDEQLRRRYGRLPPVEVTYDDYTSDIEVNRLIKAALLSLRRLPIRNSNVRSSLQSFDLALSEVSVVDYQGMPLPEILFNRLNAHYEPAVRLAMLILRATSFESEHGQVRSSSFLVNMNEVFENFVVVALREALALPSYTLPQGAKGRSLRLDRQGSINLEPDISWWEGGHCVFVGDVKYKKTSPAGIIHADLYQLLSYTVASDLPTGLLIYAKGEAEDVVHAIAHVDKELAVRTLDLTQSPGDILRQIDVLADLVTNMRARASKSAEPRDSLAS